MQERDMCKFDGKTVKTFTTCIPSPEYIMVTTESGVYKNGINLSVKKNDERGNLLYRYDTVNGTETLIDYTGKLFTGYSSCSIFRRLLYANSIYVSIKGGSRINVNEKTTNFKRT